MIRHSYLEDSIESQIKRAQHALDLIKDEEIKSWLSLILETLKNGKYVRVKEVQGNFVDVSAIAFTQAYASFFDVYNHIDLFNTSTEPIIIDELRYVLKCSNY